nr:hypothetical protein GCM10020241_61740 [Streptoalloteichus tenebrarius]
MPMLSDEDLYVFDTTGFLVVRGAFDADEVRRFRAELDELSATEPYANTERFDDLTAHSPTFGKLALDDRVVGRARDVINQPMRLLEAYALRRQRHSALYLHGGYAELLDMPDRTVGRDLSIMHTYHDGRIYCTYVKALIYLSAIRTQEDGSFCYLHGSHKANFPLLRARARRGERRSLIDEGFPTLADVFVEAGDLLLLNEGP